jgi:hypothetical protein
MNFLVQPQQRQRRDDAEVEHARAREDRGCVERHVQVRGGQEVPCTLELGCVDPFGDA